MLTKVIVIYDIESINIPFTTASLFSCQIDLEFIHCLWMLGFPVSSIYCMWLISSENVSINENITKHPFSTFKCW